MASSNGVTREQFEKAETELKKQPDLHDLPIQLPVHVVENYRAQLWLMIRYEVGTLPSEVQQSFLNMRWQQLERDLLERRRLDHVLHQADLSANVLEQLVEDARQPAATSYSNGTNEMDEKYGSRAVNAGRKLTDYTKWRNHCKTEGARRRERILRGNGFPVDDWRNLEDRIRSLANYEEGLRITAAEIFGVEHLWEVVKE